MVDSTTQTELNLIPFHHSADSAILFPSSSCREEDESNFRSENHIDDAITDEDKDAEDIVYRLNKKNIWQETIKYVDQYGWVDYLACAGLQSSILSKMENQFT